MGVKKFRISLPITLKILIILKNYFYKYGLKKGAFLEDIAELVGRSKTTINDVLRFLEEKKFIIRENERTIKPGKKRKENFISQIGLKLLKTEFNDIFIQDIEIEKNFTEIEQEKECLLM